MGPPGAVDREFVYIEFVFFPFVLLLPSLFLLLSCCFFLLSSCFFRVACSFSLPASVVLLLPSLFLHPQRLPKSPPSLPKSVQSSPKAPKAPMWLHLGSILAHHGSILAPSWPILRNLAYFASFCGHLLPAPTTILHERYPFYLHSSRAKSILKQTQIFIEGGTTHRQKTHLFMFFLKWISVLFFEKHQNSMKMSPRILMVGMCFLIHFLLDFSGVCSKLIELRTKTIAFHYLSCFLSFLHILTMWDPFF